MSMKKIHFYTSLLIMISPYFGQALAADTLCSWGTLRTFNKASAANDHCTMFAAPNGFRPENSKRMMWVNDCMGVVNAAIASCADTDLQCQKDRIMPLRGPVCALNEKYKD
jgi:hypothetical protein